MGSRKRKSSFLAVPSRWAVKAVSLRKKITFYNFSFFDSEVPIAIRQRLRNVIIKKNIKKKKNLSVPFCRLLYIDICIYTFKVD